MFKRTIAAVMILAVTLCLNFVAEAKQNFGNGNGRDDFHSGSFTPSDTNAPTARVFDNGTPSDKSGDQWLIYWYACGTDIESGRILFGPGTDLATNKIVLAEPTRRTGDVTRCIRELERADLSSGKVTVLMQAGGTMVWGHEKFRSNNASIRITNEIAKFPYSDGSWKFRTRNEEENPKNFYTEHINIEEPYKIKRYVFSDKERDWNPREVFPFDPNDPKSKMGSQAGLEDFLSYGKALEQELFPDGNVRRIFIFRDHGGGSLGGVCFDEYSRGMLNAENLYGATSVQIKDIQSAFNSVWETSPENTLNNPPFEIVAFDACLMSTYETAVALEGIAHYMVASQASTYGRVSYDYDAFVTQLSNNPAMSGEQFGKVICNTYLQDSLRTEGEYQGIQGSTTGRLTVSVTDITKIPAVTAAYENFGNALSETAGDFQNDFIRDMGATWKEIYSNANEMVDLKTLAVEYGKIFPNVRKTSNELVEALKHANKYNLRGDNGTGLYKTVYPYGGGLSTYYPLSLNNDSGITRYENLGNLAPASMRKLYRDMFNASKGTAQPSQPGTTNPPGDRINTDAPTVPAGNRYDLSDLATIEPEVNYDTKAASIHLDAQQLSRISGVRCQVARFHYYEDEHFTEQVELLFLGGDTGITENWKTGDFESTFRGKWLKIDGHPVFVQVVTDATKKSHGKIIGGYEIYAIPIVLNGRLCSLSVSCEYPSQTYRIIGAQPDSDSDIPVDEIYGLGKGDVVSPVYLRIKLSETDVEKFEGATQSEMFELVKDRGIISLVAGTPFTIGDSVTVQNGTLPDGRYAYMFEFVNPVGGENAYTQPVVFNIKGGKISSTERVDETVPEKSQG